jgi:hypothetical protein
MRSLDRRQFPVIQKGMQDYQEPEHKLINESESVTNSLHGEELFLKSCHSTSQETVLCILTFRFVDRRRYNEFHVSKHFLNLI